MLVTDDRALADRVRLLRSHGMTALSWDRERGQATGYDVLAPGFNYRLDEARAAIGLVQLGAAARGERRPGRASPSATASGSTASSRSRTSRRVPRPRTTWRRSSCRPGAGAPTCAAR